MPQDKKPKREQIGVTATPEMRANLDRLCSLYAKRLGLSTPLTQAQALEMVLREAVAKLDKG